MSRKPATPRARRQATPPAPVSRRTLRLTFQYDASQIEIVSQMRVDMLTPPSLTPRPDKTSSGYWVELRDRRGRHLFHRVLADSIRDSVETYPHDKPIERERLREVKGRFEVLLPDLEDGAEVVIMGHPISEAGLLRHKPVGVLAKFDIRRGDTTAGQP